MTRSIISTNQAPAAIGPYSQAVKIGALVFTSGQLGMMPADGTLPDSIEEQAQQAFKNLSAILAEAGGALSDVIKFTLFLTDLNDFVTVNQIMTQYVAEPFPARSTVEVSALPKGAKFEIEAIAQIAHKD